MTPKNLNFTAHSISKFKDLKGCVNDEKAVESMSKMLGSPMCHRVDLDPMVAGTRMARNMTRFENPDSVYYEYNGQYRFVLVGDTVVTFERIWKFRKRR